MSWFRTFMTEDIVPLKLLNVLFVPTAAVAGGLVFARSGSWWYAIQLDLFVLGGLWILVFPAKWLAEGIVLTVERIVQ